MSLKKKLPAKKLINIGIFLIVYALLLFVADTFLNPYILRIINVIGINVILAMSLNLTNGFVGTFSLGHVAFMGIGAYISSILTLPVEKKAMMIPDLPGWLLNTELGFLPALLLGAVVAAFFALLIGVSVLRLKGHYLALSTLGFMVILQKLLVNLEKYTKGARGINGIPGHTNIWWIYGIALVTFVVLWHLINSRFGRSMKAIREDESAAQSFGINPFKYKLLAFTVGAVFAAIAGGLWAHVIQAITPGSFYYVQTFSIVMMVILGGAGSLSGSIIGATLITIFPEFMRFFERGEVVFGIQLPQLYGLSNVAIAVFMVIILIYRPGGIMGTKEINFKNLKMPRFLKPKANKP